MEKIEKVGRMFRQSLIDDIKEGVENNKSVFLISYTSVSASAMDNLRKDMSRLGAQVYVSKNRIAKIALKELDQESLAETIEGQTAFAWSNEDSVEITKALMKFTKMLKKVSIQGGLLDGAVLSREDIKRLSELPSKDILRARLLQMILLPLTRFAGALNAKSRDLLSILKQLSEKKEGGK